jgi:hypothetical protein
MQHADAAPVHPIRIVVGQDMLRKSQVAESYGNDTPGYGTPSTNAC